MSDSMDDLVRALVARSKEELRASLRPALDKLSAAVNALNEALGEESASARPAGRGPGRPAGSGASKAGKKAKAGAPRGRRKAGKMPPGTLAGVIKTILEKKSPMRVAEIRDAVLSMPEYHGHQPKSIYTQIVTTLRKTPETIQVARGVYSFKKR